jgi:hypothetical protein
MSSAWRRVVVGVDVTCSDYIALSCTLTLQPSAVEETRGAKVIAVQAITTTHGVRPHPVTLATDTFTIGAGQTAAIDLALNPQGQRLLALTHRMTANLTLTETDPAASEPDGTASQRVTINGTPVRNRHR